MAAKETVCVWLRSQLQHTHLSAVCWVSGTNDQGGRYCAGCKKLFELTHALPAEHGGQEWPPATAGPGPASNATAASAAAASAAAAADAADSAADVTAPCLAGWW